MLIADCKFARRISTGEAPRRDKSARPLPPFFISFPLYEL